MGAGGSTTRRRLGAAIAAVVGLGLLGAPLPGCGDTPGGLVSVQVELGGVGAAEHVTSSGWEVTLTEARIVLGPVYAYAPEPLARRFERALVPLARAHGGVDPLNGRRVRLEVLDAHAVDLLASPRSSPQRFEAEAESGAVDAVTLVLRPPAGPLASATRGHQAWVAGEARRDGRVIAFEGGLDLPAGGLADRVEDVAADLDLEAGGTFHVAVRFERWFDEADFGGLVPEGDGVATLGEGDPVRNAWFLAVRSARGYAVDFTPGEDAE